MALGPSRVFLDYCGPKPQNPMNPNLNLQPKHEGPPVSLENHPRPKEEDQRRRRAGGASLGLML